MMGTKTWWIKQGAIVGTTLSVGMLLYLAFTFFQAGSLGPAVALSIVAVVVGSGGAFAWSRYSRLDRLETLENQIYGPK